MTELKDKKLYVFDMDGTIYLGNRVFPAALEFIKNLRKSGKKILFFTNNASHSREFYLAKLKRLGFEPQENEIMTSGDVTCEYLLKYRSGKTVYLVGTEELVGVFKNKGITLTDGSHADIVVTSFDTELTYEKMKNACQLIMRGSEYLSTHPDFNCPTEDGFIPDSGAISAFVTASTGVTPTYFGKPYATAIDMMCSYTGVSKEDAVVFGDRLYTDIALGKRAGVTAVLVLTGETKEADLAACPADQTPDMVYESLGAVGAEMFGTDNK